jgi:hypothetical protein
MATLFCCSDVKPYKAQYILHQSKFTEFMTWAAFPRESTTPDEVNANANLTETPPAFAVQLVRQVNYGPIEFKRYFVPVKDTNEFAEVVEEDLINANFRKLSS